MCKFCINNRNHCLCSIEEPFRCSVCNEMLCESCYNHCPCENYLDFKFKCTKCINELIMLKLSIIQQTLMDLCEN